MASQDWLPHNWNRPGAVGRQGRANRAIYETYDANTGSGNDVRSSDAYYHWGALLGVIGLLEHGR